MALSTIPNNMQAAITAAEMPAGSVIQTVSFVKTDLYSSSSTSIVSTGLEVTITPQFATSKILVTGSVNVCGYGHYDLRLVRDNGVDIMLGDAGGSNEIRGTYHGYRTTSYNTTYDADGIALNYLDSPNTTNATTYKLYAGNPNSSSYQVYINYQYSNGNHNWSGRCASSITAQEIKQ